MLRGMIFVDHMNFDIALQDYYKSLGKSTAKLDYNKLFRNLTKLVDNVDFVKASIFIPKPDDFLVQDSRLNSYYTWASRLRNAPFTDVIEGRYCGRQVDPTVPMDIAKKNTYYKVEKGTDINLAVDAINKAFHNSYDIAFIMSADTDYLTVYDVLKSYGKLVVVVAVQGQSVRNIKSHVDSTILLDESFFNTCLRMPAPTATSSDTESTGITAPVQLTATASSDPSTPSPSVSSIPDETE